MVDKVDRKHGGRRAGAGRKPTDRKRVTSNYKTPTGVIEKLYLVQQEAVRARGENIYLYDIVEPLIESASSDNLPTAIVRSSGYQKPFPPRLLPEMKEKLSRLSCETGHSISSIIDSLVSSEALRVGILETDIHLPSYWLSHLQKNAELQSEPVSRLLCRKMADIEVEDISAALYGHHFQSEDLVNVRLTLTGLESDKISQFSEELGIGKHSVFLALTMMI